MKRRKAIFLCSLGVLLTALLLGVFADRQLTHAQQPAQHTTIFPPLTGHYKVGKVDYDLVDSSRQEIFVDDPNARREILLSVYYPAHPAEDAQPAPFLTGKTLETFSQAYNVPANFITQNIHSHAYADPPLAKRNSRYPVVIFSPGWGTNPLLYAPTLEDLASHGYIVAAIWHTYSCDFTVFPDGRVVLANKAGSDPDHYPDEQDQQDQIRERVGGVWMADARFVLDTLAQFDQHDTLFAHHIDLDDIGMFGHSFGGTVSLALAAQDARLHAAANLDGGLSFGSTLPTGLQKPMLQMRAADPQYTDEQLKQMGLTRQQYEEILAHANAQYHTYYEQSDPGYSFRLKGSTHETYESLAAVVAPLLPNQLPPDVVGTINGQRAVLVYDTYLEAFFGRYLQHREEPLLHGPSPRFPEVEFEAHK